MLENERRLLQRLDHHQISGLGLADEQDLLRQNGPDLERAEVPDVAEEVEMRDPVARPPRRRCSRLGTTFAFIAELNRKKHS